MPDGILINNSCKPWKLHTTIAVGETKSLPSNFKEILLVAAGNCFTGLIPSEAMGNSRFPYYRMGVYDTSQTPPLSFVALFAIGSAGYISFMRADNISEVDIYYR